MDIITYLNEKGHISIDHINRLINPNRKFYLDDDASLLFDLLKFPEDLILEAINSNAESESEKYEKVVVSLTDSITELNKKLIVTANALILRYDVSSGRYIVASKDRDTLTQNRIKTCINKPVSFVNVINAVLLQKIKHEKMKTADIRVEREVTSHSEMSNIIDLIILDAIAQDANDIHINTVWDNNIRDYVGEVQFRISPDLLNWTKMRFSLAQVNELKNVICSRSGKPSSDANKDSGFKFLSNLNFPDYEFRISFQKFDLQYNPETSVKEVENETDKFQSSYVGLKITLRIQAVRKTILPSKDLHLSYASIERLKEAYQANSGLIAITGAFGAGKNTTYSSIINEAVSSPNYRPQIVVEIGNPIEYKLPIVQIPYYDAAHVREIVASMKTHDVDKIIVTEFRDPEIGALIKDNVISNIQVMLTFHITRVWDFIEKYREYFGERDFLTMLGSTRLIFHQAMFKELCPACKKELEFDKMTSREKKAYHALKLNGHKVYTASVSDPNNPCRANCFGGYLATRLPMSETVYFDNQDKDAISLMHSLQDETSYTTMRKMIKAYTLNNGYAFEYLARKRLIAGKIDFLAVMEKEIYETVTDEGIKKYEEDNLEDGQ